MMIEQLQMDIINELEEMGISEQTRKNIEIFKNEENPNYEEFIQDIKHLKNKWIDKLKNEKLDKIKIKKSYIEDGYNDWEDLEFNIIENNLPIMIVGDTISGNEFINIEKIENFVWDLTDYMDEWGYIIDEASQKTELGHVYSIDEMIDDIEELTGRKTTKTKLNMACRDYVHNNDIIEFINTLFDIDLYVEESRGYSQSDYAKIIYDRKKVNDLFIEEIDNILWGKGYGLTIINGIEYDYLNMYGDWIDDEEIKEYVSDYLSYNVEELEVVED